VLYALLLRYAWQRTVCWPNQDSLAADAGCSVRNVQRWLHELEVGELIRIHQRGLNRPNLYEILPLPESLDHDLSDATDLSHPDTTDLSHPETTGLSGQDTTNPSPLKDSPEKDPKDNNSPKVRRGPREPESSARRIPSPVVVSQAGV